MFNNIKVDFNMGYIYLRKNLINGKCYVGQTVDIERRNRDWNNLNWKYGGVLIERARAKYGADGFSFEILKECEDDELNYWEMYYIKEYNSKVPNGYNSTEGGEGNRGYTWSEEARKKQSQIFKGRKRPAEAVAKSAAAQRGKNHWTFRKKFSSESVEKMSAAHRGKKLSEEHKRKISATLKGKARPYVTTALRGKKRPAEVVAKILAAKRGKHYPKIAAAHSKAVQALDPKTLQVVMEFPSAAEAERQYGFLHNLISACCNGKRKTHKGFIWRYKENAQE